MTKLALIVVTVVISFIGAACSLIVIPRASQSVGYAAWHVWPYLLIAALALAQPRLPYIWLGAVAFMAIVDAWVLTETLLGSNSPVLMLLGLLAAYKPIVLLPVGVVIGAAVQWNLARST
jgi:hypothetical protein